MTIQNRVHKYLTSGRSWYQRPTSNIKKITIHHSAHSSLGSLDQDLRFIYNVHSGHGWPGLAYHFVIGKDGTVVQTNSFNDITWHDAINDDSIGILLVGYFHQPKNEKPTKQQLESLKELLDKLCTQHPEFPADHDDVVGHRERSSTSCPGDNLIGYVKDYRNKKGAVNWGKAVKSDEHPTDEVYKLYRELWGEELKPDSVRAHKSMYDRVVQNARERQKDLEKQQAILVAKQQKIEDLQEVISRHGNNLLEVRREHEAQLVALEKRHKEELAEVVELDLSGLEQELEELRRKVMRYESHWFVRLFLR